MAPYKGVCYIPLKVDPQRGWVSVGWLSNLCPHFFPFPPIFPMFFPHFPLFTPHFSPIFPHFSYFPFFLGNITVLNEVPIMTVTKTLHSLNWGSSTAGPCQLIRTFWVAIGPKTEQYRRRCTLALSLETTATTKRPELWFQHCFLKRRGLHCYCSVSLRTRHVSGKYALGLRYVPYQSFVALRISSFENASIFCMWIADKMMHGSFFFQHERTLSTPSPLRSASMTLPRPV